MYVVNSNCIDCSDNITLASRVMMESSRRYRANVCRGNIVIKKNTSPFTPKIHRRKYVGYACIYTAISLN